MNVKGKQVLRTVVTWVVLAAVAVVLLRYTYGTVVEGPYERF